MPSYLTEALLRFCTRDLYSHWESRETTYAWIVNNWQEDDELICPRTLNVALLYMEKQGRCPSSIDTLLDYFRRNPDRIPAFEKSEEADKQLCKLKDYESEIKLDDEPLFTALWTEAKKQRHQLICGVSRSVANGSALTKGQVVELFPDLRPAERQKYTASGPEAAAQITIDLLAQGFGEDAADDFETVDMSNLTEVATLRDEDGNADTFCLYSADSIEPGELLWLWPEKFVAGAVTIISGAGGCGKTTCISDWIARITTGRDWPNGAKNTYGARRVLFCSEEDDPVTVTIPRLIAAGADRSKVQLIKIVRRVKGGKNTEAILNITNHIRGLIKVVEDNPDIALLVLDPLTSYIGGANMNKTEEMAPLMKKLSSLCQKNGITVLALVHSSKRSDVNAQEKIMGAGTIVNSSRGAWVIARDAEDKDKYRMGYAKGNNVKKKNGMEFKIVSTEVEYNGKIYKTSKIDWIGESDMDADDMLAAHRDKLRSGNEDSKMNLAIAVLRETVPCFAKDALQKAEAEGVIERQLFRAKNKLGIKTDTSRGKGKAYWYIPGEKGDPALRPVIAETFVPEETLV
jgi:putative DNA primase/helicase